jgi:glycerol uptake facilitator-like aquaporin
MFGKRKVAALVAEFLGAGVVTLLILSVQYSSVNVPFFVALGGGLAVAIMTFAVGGTSGGHFNPALTIAMWTARKLSTVSMIFYIAVQLLGGWAAYALYHYFVHTSLQDVGGHFTLRILVAETIGTLLFSFGWAAAVYQRFTLAARASMSGLAYVIGIIAISSAAIGLLNPAAAIGIRAWTIWGTMGWGTYALGPVIGAVVGVNLYALLFAEPEVAVATSTANAAKTSVSAKAAEVVTVAPTSTKAATKKTPVKRKTTTRKKK